MVPPGGSATFIDDLWVGGNIFDPACDDFTKVEPNSAFHDDVHYSLMFNSVGLTTRACEWVAPLIPNANTGVNECTGAVIARSPCRNGQSFGLASFFWHRAATAEAWHRLAHRDKSVRKARKSASAQPSEKPAILAILSTVRVLLSRAPRMHWRQRLVQIGLAGGLLVPACDDSMESASKGLSDAATPIPTGSARCNGNPDPCCVDEASLACLAKKQSGSDAGTGATDVTLADAQGVAADGNTDDASPADAPTRVDADGQSDTRVDAPTDAPSEPIDAETGASLPDP
jgi:hypothetical protein